MRSPTGWICLQQKSNQSYIRRKQHNKPTGYNHSGNPSSLCCWEISPSIFAEFFNSLERSNLTRPPDRGQVMSPGTLCYRWVKRGHSITGNGELVTDWPDVATIHVLVVTWWCRATCWDGCGNGIIQIGLGVNLLLELSVVEKALEFWGFAFFSLVGTGETYNAELQKVKSPFYETNLQLSDKSVRFTNQGGFH